MPLDDAGIAVARRFGTRLDQLDVELVFVPKIENVEKTLFQAQAQLVLTTTGLS